ncbi:MAG: response regulator transcription factor, partial [Trebonia sp.]
AADLTTSIPRKRRYLTRASELAYQLGQIDAGDVHRAGVALLADDEHSRLLLEELAEAGDVAAEGGIARIQMLIALAERARALRDERLAGSFLRSAAYRCWAREPGIAAAHAVVRLVNKAASSLPETERAVALAYADPIDSAGTVAAILHAVNITESDSVTLQALAHAASCISDFELADTFYSVVIAQLRNEGRLQLLPEALVVQSWARLRRGQWSTAMPLAEEGCRLAEEIGLAEFASSGFAARAMVAALRGEVAEVAPAADQAERIALPNRINVSVAVSMLARATAAAAEGDFSNAWHYLARMHDPADPAFHPTQALWSLSHLAYAAVQCDRLERTRELTGQLTSKLSMNSVRLAPAAHMNTVYADALLVPDEQIDQRVRVALASDVGSWPFERSRMQLLLGSRLRRQKRIVDSRELLLAAMNGFEGLGAGGWAERAREELRAAGVPSLASAPAAWNALSAQELQVARMAAEGLTNKQIGERLYMSHRTVASHLYHIFPKLGITSRVQLTAMSLDLPSGAPPPGAGQLLRTRLHPAQPARRRRQPASKSTRRPAPKALSGSSQAADTRLRRWPSGW